MQHEHTEHIAAAPDAVYAAIADVSNLPRFVPQMTAARRSRETALDRSPLRGSRAARRGLLPRRRAAAQDRVERAERLPRLDAGAPRRRRSRLTLFLNTRHGSERDHDVGATLDAIRMLVESEV